MTATWTGAYRGVDGIMESSSGSMVNILDPDPATIRIGDIAAHLSKLCRFCGATSLFYSVAEHSCLVLEVYRKLRPDASKNELRAVLLHDSSEAFLGDVTRNTKAAIAPLYKPLEAKMEAAIFKALDIEPLTDWQHADMKKADDAVCRAEAKQLMHSEGEHWHWNGTPIVPVKVVPYTWQAAQIRFLSEWESLK